MLQLTGMVSEIVSVPAQTTKSGMHFDPSIEVQVLGRTVNFGIQKGAMFNVRAEPKDKSAFEKFTGKRIRIWVDEYKGRLSFVDGSPIEEVKA